MAASEPAEVPSAVSTVILWSSPVASSVREEMVVGDLPSFITISPSTTV